jgi:hypothetical protein
MGNTDTHVMTGFVSRMILMHSMFQKRTRLMGEQISKREES